MMKKTLFLIVFVLLATSVLALEPTLDNSFTITPTPTFVSVNNGGNLFLEYLVPSFASEYTKIYDVNSGTALVSLPTAISGGYDQLIYAYWDDQYKKLYLMFDVSTVIYIVIYDYTSPSSITFHHSIGSIAASDGRGFVPVGGYMFAATNGPTFFIPRSGANTSFSGPSLGSSNTGPVGVYDADSDTLFSYKTSAGNTFYFPDFSDTIGTNGSIANNISLPGPSAIVYNYDSNNPKFVSDDGRKINAANLGSALTTTLDCPSSFIPLYYVNDSSIFGYSGTNLSSCDFSNEINPITTIYPINAFSVADAMMISTDRGKKYVAGTNGSTAYIFEIDFPVTGTGAGAVDNEPPVYQIKFLGTDLDVTNFLFRVIMSDEEGGPAFYAQLVDEEGAFFANSTSISTIKFNRPADIDFVSNEFCPTIFNLSAGVPGETYGSDGFLEINRTTGCLYPTTVTLDPINVFEIEGDIFVDATVNFDNELSYPGSNSFSIYSSSNVFIGQLLFDQEGTFVNISLPNGTLIATNASMDGNGWYIIRAIIDGNDRTINWKVYNHVGTLLTNYNDITGAFGDVGTILIDAYISDTGMTDVDTISIYGQKKIVYPPYLFFDNLVAGGLANNWKSVAVPINSRGFGEYETYLWGTDQELGLEYYENPDYETFTFNSETPKLTDAEVQAVIDGLNTGVGAGFGQGAIAGDLATDWLPRLYNQIGVKTAASRFILGLVLIIILTLMVAGAGSVAIVIVDSVAAVIFALPQINLFPAWFLIIYVIIAAGLGAMALRKGTTGG